MNVTAVDVQPLDLPLVQPFEIALGTQHEAENLHVTVTLDDGTVGHGEGSPIPPITGETQASAVAIGRDLTPAVMDRSVAEYRTIIADLHAACPGAVSTLFAYETAILDAYTRAIDIPLASLFGGQPSTVETDLTIPIVDPDPAATQAKSAVDRGFEHLKIKTGANVEHDVARVVAVADAAPTAAIKVDANQGWTPSEAIRFADQLDERGIELELLEQPVRADDLLGLARVTHAVGVPVAADEAVFTPGDALAVISADAADIINVKLGKSGLIGAHAIVDIARAANRELMVGCMLESSIGIHAAAHLVSGTDAFTYVDLDGNQLLARDTYESSAGPRIEPHGPGLGFEPVLVH